MGDSETITAMKFFRLLSIAICSVLCLVLYGCQSDTTHCQTVADPFPILDTPETWQLYFGPNIKVDQVCTFTGQVTKGETYKQQISQDLVFCLIPSQFFGGESTGWQMKISNSIENDCGENFAPIANPPMHGNLLFEIHGWEFRNDDNTRDDPNGINAAKIRQFHFLLNENDNKTAQNYYDCTLWGLDCPQDYPIDQKVDITKIPRSVGIFSITDLKLGNLLPNQKAWIEQMKFEVKIYLPSNR